MGEPMEDLDGRLVLLASRKSFLDKDNELTFAVEEEVFFPLKVVEDRHCGDIGGFCNLRDRHVVEAALDKEACCRVGDGGSHFLLLSFSKTYTSASFQGETCDFAAEQVQELAKCIGRFRDRRNEKAKFRRPTPGEPVIVFSEEIWKFVREENRDIVNSLMEIISSTFRDDPESFKQAIDQLEQQIGLAGISRFISVGSSESGHAGNIGGQANGHGRQQPVAVVLIAVGIGLLGLVIGRLTAGSRNRL